MWISVAREGTTHLDGDGGVYLTTELEDPQLRLELLPVVGEQPSLSVGREFLRRLVTLRDEAIPVDGVIDFYPPLGESRFSA